MRWALGDEDYRAVLRWRGFWLRDDDESTEYGLQHVPAEVKSLLVIRRVELANFFHDAVCNRRVARNSCEHPVIQNSPLTCFVIANGELPTNNETMETRNNTNTATITGVESKAAKNGIAKNKAIAVTILNMRRFRYFCLTSLGNTVPKTSDSVTATEPLRDEFVCGGDFV